MKRSSYVLIVGALVLLVAVLFLANHARHVYSLRVDFVTVPADDVALTRWIESQPGVTKASVRREGTTLLVDYETQFWSSPVDVLSHAEKAGYAGRGNYANRATSRWW